MRARFTNDAHQRVDRLVEDVGALIEAVRRLREPTMLSLSRDDCRLTLGQGHAESVLAFVDAAGARFHSVGNLSAIGSIPFWSEGDREDFFADQAVAESLAIEAAHFFAECGQRLPTINWQPDW